VSDREEPYHEMAGLLIELDGMMDLVMSCSLCDENDRNIPVYEWNFFDPMRNDYNDPLIALEGQKHDAYNFDLCLPSFVRKAEQ
jgi:hypothetical protein